MSKIYHTGMVHYAAQADRYEWPCTGAELPSTSGTAGLLTWRCDIGTKGNPCLSVSMYFLYLCLYIDALCEPSVPWQPLRLTTFELVLTNRLPLRYANHPSCPPLRSGYFHREHGGGQLCLHLIAH